VAYSCLKKSLRKDSNQAPGGKRKKTQRSLRKREEGFLSRQRKKVGGEISHSRLLEKKNRLLATEKRGESITLLSQTKSSQGRVSFSREVHPSGCYSVGGGGGGKAFVTSQEENVSVKGKTRWYFGIEKRRGTLNLFITE